MDEYLLKQFLAQNVRRMGKKGKETAKALLESNRATEPETIEAVLKTAMDFREFQGLALYHKYGYFRQIGDYQKSMPMLPQQLSPLFGCMMGEMAFALFAAYSDFGVPKPTFLSLGAGRGFLDHDLIDHVTSNDFIAMSGDFPAHGLAISRDSDFIITDIGGYSTALLKEELKGVLQNTGLAKRISIRQLDATDFLLDKNPYGIVYSNELIDNMPTEPIVSINGGLHAVKVLAFNRSGAGENSEYARKIKTALPLTKEVISKKQFKARADANDAEHVGFEPVFIPLEYDEFLSHYIKGLGSIRRINDWDYGGVYPLHLGLDGMFRSIRKSFDRGVVVLIDYDSKEQGMHNWNVAVNFLKDYRFGKEDVDFQIDPKQVIERAEKFGFVCADSSPLEKTIRQILPILEFKGPPVISRWIEAQGIQIPGGIRNPKALEAFNGIYSLGLSISKTYNMTILYF